MANYLRTSYSSSYFSIDSILASETPISTRIQVTIPKLGYLANLEGYFTEDLEPGTEMKLPLWLVPALSRPSGRNQPNYLTVMELPQMFKDALWEVIAHEPSTADLRSFHEQFFELGLFCSTLCHKDVTSHAESMVEMFNQRVLSIGERSLGGGNRKILDNLERKLVDDWGEAEKKLSEYLAPLTTSEEVKNAEGEAAAPPEPKVPRMEMEAEVTKEGQHGVKTSDSDVEDNYVGNISFSVFDDDDFLTF